MQDILNLNYRVWLVNMITIRQMYLDDLEAVTEVDALAFQTERRTYQHLRACLELNPKGCFVATVTEDSPIGYIFSRIWGSLGWMGVGGVHPEHQQKGIGKALFNKTVQHLQEVGCAAIGGSTQTADDVGIWASLGCVPGPPNLEMHKFVNPTSVNSPFAFFSQLDRELALKAIRQISQEARPGLDYSAEVCNACDYAWGETLLFGWPYPWALAIIRTDPIRKSVTQTLRISVLAMHTAARQQLVEVFSAIEQLAYDRHYSKLEIFVDAGIPDALQQALNYGFKVKDLWIRLALHQTPPLPTAIDLSLWAM